jgi:hypothetical protein
MLLPAELLDGKTAAGAPIPQGGAGGTGSHGQPQAGSSPSTPGPGGGGSIGGAIGSGGGGGATGFSTGIGAAGAASFGLGVTGGSIGGGSTGGGAGGGAAASGTGWSQSKGPARRGRGWRDWRRGDPTLIKGLWKSKGPLGKRSYTSLAKCGSLSFVCRSVVAFDLFSRMAIMAVIEF